MNQGPITAFVGGTIIDGTGRAPIYRGVVLVQGKRIAAVGDATLSIPAEAHRVSAEGHYIIPGLLDANVHLVLDYWPLTLIRYEARYDELAIEAAQVTLKNGVTTVFDTWGPLDFLRKARAAVETGETIGSRIFLAGNIVGLGGPFSPDFLQSDHLLQEFPTRVNALWEQGVGADLVWKSPAQVRTAIRHYLSRGIDFLKFAVTTHCGDQRHIVFSPRVQAAIVEEARAAGKTVQTHSTTNEGLHLALEANVDLVQHADLTFGPEPLPDETIELLAARRTAAAILPQTQSALEWYRAHSDRTPWLKRYEVMDRNVRNLLQGGANLLLSTDGGLFSSNTLNSSSWESWQPPTESLLTLGEGHFHWLLAMQQKGMSPMQALQAATQNIARAYGVEQQIGTLEPGKLADLVILEKNPLEHASNYRSIIAVIKEGERIDRDALPTRRLLTAETQTSPEQGSAAPKILTRPCSLASGRS